MRPAQKTRIGVVIAKMRKVSNKQVAARAAALVKAWKVVARKASKSPKSASTPRLLGSSKKPSKATAVVSPLTGAKRPAELALPPLPRARAVLLKMLANSLRKYVSPDGTPVRAIVAMQSDGTTLTVALHC